MLGEFSEEYLQEILDPVFRHIALKTEEEMNLLSPDALYAGFLGALFGTGVESVDAAINGLSAESTAMDSSTKDSDYAEFADILNEPEDLENFKYLASLDKAEQEAFIASLTVDALEEGKPATALEDAEFADILSEPEDLENFKYLASLDKAEQEAFIESLTVDALEEGTPVTAEEILNPEAEISRTEDLPVEETAERGIIKEKNTTKGIGIQYFANKGLDKQSDRELQKSIRSWNVIIEKHKDKVNNPAKYDKDWAFKDEREKAGLVKHWEKEIRTTEKCIKEANELLAKRKGEEK